jgi:hypothetical protein
MNGEWDCKQQDQNHKILSFVTVLAMTIKAWISLAGGLTGGSFQSS